MIEPYSYIYVRILANISSGFILKLKNMGFLFISNMETSEIVLYLSKHYTLPHMFNYILLAIRIWITF